MTVERHKNKWKKYKAFSAKDYETIYPWVDGFDPHYIDTVRLLKHVARESKEVHELEHAAGLSTAQINQVRHPELRIIVVGLRWLGATRPEIAKHMKQAVGSRMCITTATDSTWSHAENFLRDVQDLPSDPSAVQVGELVSYRRLRTLALQRALQHASETAAQCRLDAQWQPAPEYITLKGLAYLKHYYETYDRPHPLFPVFIPYVFERLSHRRAVAEKKRQADLKVAQTKKRREALEAEKKALRAREQAEEQKRREALEAKYASRPKVQLPEIKMDFDF